MFVRQNGNVAAPSGRRGHVGSRPPRSPPKPKLPSRGDREREPRSLGGGAAGRNGCCRACRPSAATIGHCFDCDALTESVIGSSQDRVARNSAAVVDDGGPWKDLDDLEIATCARVSWLNEERLNGGSTSSSTAPQPKSKPSTVSNLSHCGMRNQTNEPPTSPGQFTRGAETMTDLGSPAVAASQRLIPGSARMRLWVQSAGFDRATARDLLFGAALAVLSWPSSPQSLVVSVGTQGSWQSALEMAAHNDMAFGTRIVFTYGPLGFLTGQQLNFGSTAFAGFIFSLAFCTAIFATLLWSLRRVLPVWAAILVAYVVGSISLHIEGVVPEDMYAVVLTVCVAIISRSDEQPAPLWIWVALGAILTTFSLVKVSVGVGIAAILVITIASLSRDRWRVVKAVAVGAVPLFFAAWFGTGNRFDDVVPFARSSAAIISGYGPAMSYDYPYYHNPLGLFPNRTFTYWWAGVVVMVIAAFALAHARRCALRGRIGIGLVTLVAVWMLFKEGFVRHDSGHDLIFFAVAPLSLAAFNLISRRWEFLVSGLLALCIVAAIVNGGIPPLAERPLTSAKNFVNEATDLVSPSRRTAMIEQSRHSLQAWYKVPEQMLALMRGQTVDVSPQEQSVVWAYPGIRFDPMPVIQDYSAYTSLLDNLDSNFLATTNSPRFILRQNEGGTDGRNPAFEPPATQLAIECRYRQVIATTEWQLLERGSDHCGPLRSLGTVSTGFNHWVAVPPVPPRHAVVATFQLSLGLAWTLQTIVFKPPNLFMGYNDSKNYWRFVAATAPDLHVLHGASSLGYSRPFAPVSVDRLRFFVHGRGESTSGIKITFYQIAVAGTRHDQEAVSDRHILMDHHRLVTSGTPTAKM
jgi:hypothetical protein